MRTRLLLAPALVAGLFLSISGAEAATPTLDGKKTKKVSFSADGGVQDNDAWLAYDLVDIAGQGGQMPAQVRRVPATECAPPLCAVWSFVYKPAKGIKGGLMLTVNWTNPASDIDLTAVQYEKDGSKTELDACGTAGGTSEKIYLDPSMLKHGKKYAMVVTFYRSLQEAVTGTAEINVPSTMKAGPVPDDLLGLDCGQ